MGKKHDHGHKLGIAAALTDGPKTLEEIAGLTILPAKQNSGISW
jgi:hypothetical protein